MTSRAVLGRRGAGAFEPLGRTRPGEHRVAEIQRICGVRSFDQAFLAKLVETQVVDVIGCRDRPLVPVVPLAGVAAAEQRLEWSRRTPERAVCRWSVVRSKGPRAASSASTILPLREPQWSQRATIDDASDCRCDRRRVARRLQRVPRPPRPRQLRQRHPAHRWPTPPHQPRTSPQRNPHHPAHQRLRHTRHQRRNRRNHPHPHHQPPTPLPRHRQTNRRTITTLRTPQKQTVRTQKEFGPLPMSRDITSVAGTGFEPAPSGYERDGQCVRQ